MKAMKRFCLLTVLGVLLVLPGIEGKNNPSERLEKLAQKLKDPNPYNRAQALYNFGAPQNLKETRYLFPLLQDPHRLIQDIVIERMGQSRDPFSRGWMMAYGFKQKNKALLLNVLKLMAHLKAKEALPKLMALLKSKDEDLILGAAYALSEMPDKTSVLPLIDLLKKKKLSDSTKFMISIYLIKITGQDFGQDPSDWKKYWDTYEKTAKIGRVFDPCGSKKNTLGKGRRTIVQAGQSQRFGSAKLKLLKKYGGTSTTEATVFLGLDWLKRHQNDDGRWDSDDFSKLCKKGKCGDPGRKGYDTALTGLALLAYLGAGHTQLSGHFKETVYKGLFWLKKVQRKNGSFPGTMYSIGIASFAVAEAYYLTRDCRIRQMVRKAVRFICRAQKPYSAWRYRARPVDADTSITGWQVMALASARMAPEIHVPLQNLIWAGQFIEGVSTVDKKGKRTGFARYLLEGSYGPEEKEAPKASGGSPATAAVAAYCRLLLGEPLKSEAIEKSNDYLGPKFPRILPQKHRQYSQQNRYYWYYGLLFMFQTGGKWWKRWNHELVRILVSEQHRAGCLRGSFPPNRHWGNAGGRIYSTTLSVLMLEVYYRYSKK